MDREKVIKAIEKAKKQSVEYAQDRIIVPFKEADMIIALLKEQDNCENCAIAREDRRVVVLCKDCKHRSFYCTEATDGTTLYECHHPCANSVPRPGDWFCADGERKEGR